MFGLNLLADAFSALPCILAATDTSGVASGVAGMEVSVGILIIVGVIALVAEFVDSSLGMGYGTMLTPILLAMGFDVRAVVPAILFSELITGASASVFHHRFGNVDFKPRLEHLKSSGGGLGSRGLSDLFVKIFPQNLRVAMLLGLCSVLGAVIAMNTAMKIPTTYLKLYIGVLLTITGLFVLLTMNRQMKFSWLRTSTVGFVAAFNKGLSGGGYGPLVVSGQVLAGQSPRNAIGIVSFSEAMACLAGVSVFLLKGGNFDWVLTGCITSGAFLSAPFASMFVSKVSVRPLRGAIGCFTLALAGLTIYKAVG